MADGQKQHWMGDRLCQGQTRAGRPCSQWEIDGMDYCLQHMPDEYLEEAEELTGFRRCRHDFGLPSACHFYAVADTEPPTCKIHGANIGSVTSIEAGRRGIESQVSNRAMELLTIENVTERLINPPGVGNPLEALLDLAAEIRAWRLIMRDRAASLKAEQWRYAGTRSGEQVRAELLLYERAQEREAQILVQIAKLRIEEKLQAIREQQVQMIERALNLAVQASGADLAGQAEARKVLRRELKVVPAA